MKPNVRYIDPAAVAAAMAEKHNRQRLNWGSVFGGIAIAGLVLAFWWWALFC